MKKVLAGIFVVLTLACVLSVAGCDKGDPTPNPTTTATTTAPISTITTTDPTPTDPFDPCPTTTTSVPPSTTTSTIPSTSYHDCFPDNLYGLDNVRYNDSSNWGKVVDGVFTAKNGCLQIRAKDWKTYGLYNISMVPTAYNNQGITNAICIAVYEPDCADVFANKTEEDFEIVLGADINTLTATTVCGYPAYRAVSEGAYYVWVINTPNYKYFINFMQAEGFPDMDAISQAMMSEGNILIFK